jgi:hypothetical protein
MWNGFRLEAWAALGFAMLAALALVVSLLLPDRDRHT